MTATPWGFRDILPEEAQAREEIAMKKMLDAEGCKFNQIDFMHLTRHGHAQLAEKLAELVPTLL